MNNALDKYLTTEPDNGFDAYFDNLCEALDENTYLWDEAQGFAPSQSPQFSRLVEAMFNAGTHIADAINIINHAFAFFSAFPATPPTKRMKDFFYMMEPNGPELVSNCCGAPVKDEPFTFNCSKCKEYCAKVEAE